MKMNSTCHGDAMLHNALQADSEGKFESAYHYYEKGIEFYLNVKILKETNSLAQNNMKQMCHEHLKRAAVLKDYLNARNLAHSILEKAKCSHISSDCAEAYTLYVKGIETLLSSAELIKPSHPQLFNDIMKEAASHMSRAEEAKRCTTSVNRKFSNTSCHNNSTSTSTRSDANIGECTSQKHSSPAKEEDNVRNELVHVRIDSLLKESNLLLDYLKLDSEDEDKLNEIKRTSIKISTLLEEKDDRGSIVSEHSLHRDALENSLQACENFLNAPPPTSSKQSMSSDELAEKECIVCCDAAAVMATVPCGHKILCEACSVGIGETCYLCATQLIDPKCIRIFD